jgi:hypothetical protein
LLVSDNRQYEPYTIAAADVFEIWSVRGYYSANLPEADSVAPSPTDQLALKVLQLQEQLKMYKKR